VRLRSLPPALLGPRRWLRLRHSPAARRALRRASTDGMARAPRLSLRALLRQLQSGNRSVLDVGTGRMESLVDVPCPIKIGLEVHRPYLQHRVLPEAVPVNASALDLERLFTPGAVDLVTLIDVIEHFDLPDADEVLRQAEAVAQRRVLLFTPRGHFPQEGYDAFRLGGEEFQRHRSTWEPEDLTARGYRVVVLTGYHGPWNESFVEAFGRDAAPVDALVAFKDR
jgi:hypothetical protein